MNHENSIASKFNLFNLLPNGQFNQEINLIPLKKDGRVGVSAHFFWTTEQTGKGGSAAAFIKYEPGAKASAHEHSGFEIIHVLEGQLECEQGIYPAGSVLISAPGSHHEARSENGCLLLMVWDKPVITT